MGGMNSGRWVLLFAWLYAGSAAAQIVNVQALFNEKTAPQGPSAGVELSADWRTGSTALFSVRGSLLGQWRADQHIWLGVIRGEYTFAEGERIVSRVMEHLRYRNQLTDVVAGEAFAQHEYDEFRRLQLRALVGAGPRVTLWSTDTAGLVFGAAMMLEHERLRRNEEPDAGQTATDLRLSSYLLGRVNLMENIDLIETFYAQPRVTRPSDIRLLNETLFTLKPNERVTVGIGFTLIYDSAPPAAVPPLDTQLRTTVGLRL